MSGTAPDAPMRRRRDHDVAVIGGGLVGSAIAWGLAREHQRVVVFDEGDVALRASRGNFALVWVQGKGLGMAAYSHWSLRSADTWAGFARELREQTGVDVAVLHPMTRGIMPDRHLGTALAAAHNEMMVTRWLDHPQLGEKFRGTLRVNPDDVAGALREIDKYRNHPRIVQLGFRLAF